MRVARCKAARTDRTLHYGRKERLCERGTSGCKSRFVGEHRTLHGKERGEATKDSEGLAMGTTGASKV